MSVQFGKLTRNTGYSSSVTPEGKSLKLNYTGNVPGLGDYSVTTQATADKFTAEFNHSSLKFTVEQTGHSEQSRVKVTTESSVGTARAWKAVSGKIQNALLKDAQLLAEKSKKLMDFLKNSHKVDPQLTRMYFDHILRPDA